MNAIVVNLYGGPGARKSTLASLINGMLKMHNVDSELVTEYAKDVTWRGAYTILEDQIYVFGKQQHRLRNVANKVDVIVTDSPLLLCLAYADENDEIFSNMVIDTYQQYNNKNFFIQRDSHYVQVGRTQTREEAIQLDNSVLRILQEQKIPYISLKANIQTANTITLAILDELGKAMRFRIVGDNGV